jgi:hypothetical protein
MEIFEQGHAISIHAGQPFPYKKILVDAGIVLVLVWGVFSILVIFLSYPVRVILPYFIAITLLLLIPLVSGVLIRQYRHYGEILINAENRLIVAKWLWRKQQISFDDIKEFQVKKYRYRKSLFLYRVEAILVSGKPLRLIQDVPDKQALRSFGRKIEKLVNKPLTISD